MKNIRKRPLNVATENATRYSKKKCNKFTWFHYGRLALKICLWCLENKELLSEIFHLRNRFCIGINVV